MGFFRTLQRDIGSQFNQSRNIGEPLATKVRRTFWAVRYTLKGIWLGVKATRHEQLGSMVIYQGRKCFICNWAGSKSPTLSAKDFYRQSVPRDEIANVVNLRELWHRFNAIFSWYMSSWHGIDVNKRLYPRAYAEN